MGLTLKKKNSNDLILSGTYIESEITRNINDTFRIDDISDFDEDKLSYIELYMPIMNPTPVKLYYPSGCDFLLYHIGNFRFDAMTPYKHIFNELFSIGYFEKLAPIYIGVGTTQESVPDIREKDVNKFEVDVNVFYYGTNCSATLTVPFEKLIELDLEIIKKHCGLRKWFIEKYITIKSKNFNDHDRIDAIMRLLPKPNK